ncbi:hypothetical protein CDAR_475291 [Caerostris darwini]|uniref:Uncharacterized protein n=1 Tax=Caerostris darwini TaxID=1538125 RepID=A0AAV4V588_9ARAC|nr:hypothetical protein CDAR_475291 [Caerostris darwini]
MGVDRLLAEQQKLLRSIAWKIDCRGDCYTFPSRCRARVFNFESSEDASSFTRNTKAHHLISPLHTNSVSLAKYGTPFKSLFPPKPNPIIAALKVIESSNKEGFVLQGSPELFTRLSIAITLGANPVVWTFPRHCLISAKHLSLSRKG